MSTEQIRTEQLYMDVVISGNHASAIITAIRQAYVLGGEDLRRKVTERLRMMPSHTGMVGTAYPSKKVSIKEVLKAMEETTEKRY